MTRALGIRARRALRRSSAMVAPQSINQRARAKKDLESRSRARLGRKLLPRPPAPVQLVAQSLVEAVGALRPELHGLRPQQVPPPMGGARNFVTLVAGGELFHARVQLVRVRDGPTLRGCPCRQST